MDKKTQDLSWACLPKEERENIRNDCKSFCKRYEEIKSNVARGAIDTLEDLFGSHNLTSDTEPEEMLMVSRSEVIKHYGIALDASKSDDASDRVWGRYRLGLLERFFGDKCLPDKEPPVQAEPKFNIGQKVVMKFNGSIRKISSIKYTPKGYQYFFEGFNYSYYSFEEGIEPYTEPSNVSTNDTKDDTKDTMEEKEHRNKALYDALCELESASVKVRKALQKFHEKNSEK